MSRGNLTQLQRYKQVLQYIDAHWNAPIDIDIIEQVSHYSYRNINRIFQSLHQETIGQYVKRLRLERAAQYLKYSPNSISTIALDVGFGDVAAFSKAFKKRFGLAPVAFRQENHPFAPQKIPVLPNTDPLPFELETLPRFDWLCLEHRGDYEAIDQMEPSWDQLIDYATQQHLLTEHTLYLSETLDDDEISDAIHCRTHLGLTLERPLAQEPQGLFQIKTHLPQRYVKFVHHGPFATLPDTYQRLYAHWMTEVQLEFSDRPVLEFYDEEDPNRPPITEIYIPVR